MDATEKYINPFTDFGFKKLFGNEFNKDLLMDFLNQVLGGREHITQLTYLNGENQGRTEQDRRAVFDLYCENERGERFIIEVQNVRQEFFKDRSLFYATFPIQEQAVKGTGWDYELKAVYTIGILNFTFPDRPELQRCVREIRLLDVLTHEPFYEKLTFIYLEMPRFKKREEELSTHFDKWMYVLRNLPRLQSRPWRLQERIFEKLFNEAEIAKLNPAEMNTYQQSLKILRDNYSVQKALERDAREAVREEVRQEVIEEVRQEVIEEVRQEVIEEVRQEVRQEITEENKRNMARSMKAGGEPVEKISRYTGIPVSEIENL